VKERKALIEDALHATRGRGRRGGIPARRRALRCGRAREVDQIAQDEERRGLRMGSTSPRCTLRARSQQIALQRGHYGPPSSRTASCDKKPSPYPAFDAPQRASTVDMLPGRHRRPGEGHEGGARTTPSASRTLLLTTDALVATKPEPNKGKKAARRTRRRHGRGRMGGMDF
jgi:hypothetical protein